MKLNALLMCREQASLPVLIGALEELGIDEEMCASAAEAMELLALGYYSALVVDFSLGGAAQVAHMARLTPAQRRPVVFAMIDARTDIAAAFQAGANFVLYKPLVEGQVLRSLRAGRAFMLPDRRFGDSWDVLINTATAPGGDALTIRAGSVVELAGRSIMVLREAEPA